MHADFLIESAELAAAEQQGFEAHARARAPFEHADIRFDEDYPRFFETFGAQRNLPPPVNGRTLYQELPALLQQQKLQQAVAQQAMLNSATPPPNVFGCKRMARVAEVTLAPPMVDDPAELAAWQEGRTGYPVVDAGMRELAATGWMHNRVRMIAASILVKDLLVDWKLGEAHFRRGFERHGSVLVVGLRAHTTSGEHNRHTWSMLV